MPSFFRKNIYNFSAIIIFSILFSSLPAYYKDSLVLQKLSTATRDVFFKIRHFATEPPAFTQKIVIISIDQESCEKLGARWPWSRFILADLVSALTKYQAKVIGLNMTFVGNENGEDESTKALAQALSAHGNTVIGQTMSSDSKNMIHSTSFIEQSNSRVGYLEKIVDLDYSMRRSYLIRPYFFRRDSSEYDYQPTKPLFESSFALQLAEASRENSNKNYSSFDPIGGRVSMGAPYSDIYVAEDGSYTINYLINEDDLTKISAWKVLQGRVRLEDLKGKVALVGLTSSVFSDIHPTPLGIMPSIVIHANELVSIAAGRRLKFTPPGSVFLIAWLIGLGVLLLFLYRQFWLSVFGVIVAFFSVYFLSYFRFLGDEIVEPFILFLGLLTAAAFGVLAQSLKLFLENRGLESKVVHDKMTGLFKYEYLREQLDIEWKRCLRSKVPISIAMTDLDYFKKINDTLGHEVGNQMIIRAGQVIKDSARKYDVVARYGGDEFTVLLWHASYQEAKAYRLRLRAAFDTMVKSLTPELQSSSISIGVATFDPGSNPNFPANPQCLVEEADKDLFLDKESRRKDKSR